jgi:hypothetical protein
VLKIIKESPHISRRWFPLLLELPDPVLNNLVANAKNNGEAGWWMYEKELWTLKAVTDFFTKKQKTNIQTLIKQLEELLKVL